MSNDKTLGLGGIVAPKPTEAVREEDPRTRAARRAAELEDHWGGDDRQTADKFKIDPKIVPDGWTYEFRRFSIWGKEDPSYQVQLANAGWDPVPAYRHPEMMPPGYEGATIDREGQRLMERPAVITHKANARDLSDARKQVGDKEAQITGQTIGAFDENKGATILRKSREATLPMPIPK
jgi:hypothetical protein